MWMNRNLYQGDFCGALSVRAQFYRARGAQWDFRSVSAPVTPRLGSAMLVSTLFREMVGELSGNL